MCVKCDEGKTKQSFGDTTCQRCPDGSYANSARTECVPCPAVGVTCLNGLLRPDDGVWAPMLEQGALVAADSALFKCLYPPACNLNGSVLPTIRTSCAVGYSGVLCSNW